MNGSFLKDTFGWGFLLWLVGYILGILLFMLVPPSMIGWIIMPVGTIITVWILRKKIEGSTFYYYLLVGGVWTMIAILCDYLFLVKVFKPTDGYYKLDVYLYYLLTFLLPPFIGWKKLKSK
ncbi:MAG: hypothetical protein AAB557_01755 [Patescibacteria group bacterium]